MASRDAPLNVTKSSSIGSSPDPYVASSDAGDAQSTISSRIVDIASEDGAREKPEAVGRRPPVSFGKIQGVRADGSRPGTSTTIISGKNNVWSSTPASREAAGHRGAGVRNMSTSSISRPPSATPGKSHVHSISSTAFFRPMSSQRLQAQRGSRSAAQFQANSPDTSYTEGNTARHSIRSDPNSATRPEGLIQEDNETAPPPSRGTEMTDQETFDRTANTSPTNYPGGSLSESVRPLQKKAANRALVLNLNQGYKTGEGLPTASTRRSFGSNFLLPGRGDTGPNSPGRSTHGREKLSSVTSSPNHRPITSRKEASAGKAGSNYQYFTGNTVFCWGGRLQNTRHRPINVATGLLVVVPATLFFVFSAPWLWHNVSPAIPILFAYVFYICMSSFLHASFSDPGVSPSLSLLWPNLS